MFHPLDDGIHLVGRNTMTEIQNRPRPQKDIIEYPHSTKEKDAGSPVFLDLIVRTLAKFGQVPDDPLRLGLRESRCVGLFEEFNQAKTTEIVWRFE